MPEKKRGPAKQLADKQKAERARPKKGQTVLGQLRDFHSVAAAAVGQGMKEGTTLTELKTELERAKAALAEAIERVDDIAKSVGRDAKLSDPWTARPTEL